MVVKHEHKIIALLAILTLALLFVVCTIILPTLAQIKKVNTEAAALKAFLEKSLQDSQSARRSLAEQASARAEIINLGEHLYHVGDDLKLIDELENLANACQASITISNFNHDQAARRVRLDLLIQGNYLSISSFLIKLPQSSYYPQLNVIELNPSNLNHADAFNAKLQIEIYAAQ